MTAGTWQSSALPGLTLQTSWLLNEPRADELDTLHALLGEAGMPSAPQAEAE